MNESTLMQLKIIVERAVRPVRASTSRKRKMREELLAHVSDVFDEESANLGDDQSALERTAQRFGNAAEVTIQLQASVPASDCLRRFCDARPGEPALRGALRIAWLTEVLALVVFAGVLFTGGWAYPRVSALPREAAMVCVYAMLALPVYLFGLTLLTDWMEKALYDPAGRSRFKVALISVGSWLFMTVFVGFTGCASPADWDYLTAILVAVWLAPAGPMFPYALAQSATVRRRYHEEWARLPIDGANGAAI